MMKMFYNLLVVIQILAYPVDKEYWITNSSCLRDNLLKPFLVQYEANSALTPSQYQVNKWVYQDDGSAILTNIGITISNSDHSLHGYSHINRDFISSAQDKREVDQWLPLIYYVEDLEQQLDKNKLNLKVVTDVLIKKIADLESRVPRNKQYKFSKKALPPLPTPSTTILNTI